MVMGVAAGAFTGFPAALSSAIVNRLLHKPMPIRPTVEVELSEEIRAPKDMEILCMMDVKKTDTGYKVKQTGWRHGNTVDALGAGAIYVTRLGQNGHSAGESLKVTLLRGEEDFREK